MSRGVPYSANPLLRIKLPAYRSRLLLLLIGLAFIALVGRTAYLQLFTHGYLQKQGESRYGRTIELPASRGKVLDRNGIVLASSLPARAVWAAPDEVKASPDQLVALARLLEMPLADLSRRLDVKGKTFVYLKRQVEAHVAERVQALAIPGIHQRKEFKRFYPEGETLAHVVGFTNVEDVGQEGIELAQDEQLTGRPGSRRVIRDNFGRVIEDMGTLRDPLEGRDLQLSIDSKIQFHAYSALRDAIREHRAKAGAAVVLDIQTGEVLALANLPTYNPNQAGQRSGAQLRNRVITDTFEPGSTMKPFISAMALQSGRFSPQTVIQTAPGRLTIGSATIGDSHPHGALTVEQVLQKSSNVGTAKIALTFTPEKMWTMFTSVGFGQAPELGFPGAVAGRVRPHKNWRPIEQATMSYGHGISVSLIQMARAYTVFARDGDIVPLSMVRTGAPAAGVPVVDPKTARAVRQMLEMAAGPGGTAPKAQIVGYRVAGKTGTAHKQEGGRYVNKYIASFVGFAPVSNPRIVIAVMIDEPSAGRHYGGDVAAPVFAQIAGDSMRSLRVAPDAPLAKLVIPAEPVKESL
jgi:cell division protein FtsI (penicillin-binding protein 3)